MRIHRDSRVQDATPHIESGHVWIPAEAPWVNDFINECEQFTLDDSHSHDDQIDPMVDAIHDLLNKRVSTLSVFR